MYCDWSGFILLWITKRVIILLFIPVSFFLSLSPVFLFMVSSHTISCFSSFKQVLKSECEPKVYTTPGHGRGFSIKLSFYSHNIQNTDVQRAYCQNTPTLHTRWRTSLWTEWNKWMEKVERKWEAESLWMSWTSHSWIYFENQMWERRQVRQFMVQ